MGLAGNSIPKQIITSGAMTGTATINSTPFNIEDMSLIALHLVWTGTPNGTFAVQVSNNYDQTSAAAADWVALTLSPSVAAAGAASSAFINLSQLGARFVRVQYVNSSNTGTLQCYAHGKAL